jgi:hypothetical protein
MASFGSAWFLRQLRGRVVLGRYQNHWPGRLVTWESVVWAPLPFQPGAMAAGDVTAEGGASVSLPFDLVNWSRVKAAQELGDFWELRQFRFDPAGTDDGPPVSMTLWSGFLGQVVEVEMQGLAQLDVVLGSVLSPVGVQIPFRSVSSELVGVPLRL